MAAVIDMGEVDEIHSKEETLKDGLILNGDTSSVKSNEEEENDTAPSEEVMDIDGVQESDENDVEATSIEIDDDDDDEDSNQSNTIINSNAENSNTATTEKDDEEVEIHSINNSDSEDEVNEIPDDDEVNEIVDDEVNEIIDDDDDENETRETEVNLVADDEVNEIVDDDDEINEGGDESVEGQDGEVNEINEIEDDEVNEIIDDDAVEDAKEKKEEKKEHEVHLIPEENEDKIDENKEEDKKEKKIIKEKEKGKEDSIVLNDSGDGDIEIIDADLPKENGKNYSPEPTTHKIDDDDDVITLDTPTKKPKSPVIPSEPPRRSARNLNRKSSTNYMEDEDEEKEREREKEKESSSSSDIDGESDIEEVLPQDPLAVSDPLSSHPEKTYTRKPPPQPTTSSTIVVKDTKRLVEIASKSSPTNVGKKEPTLVIIDTNSILSGRGPIPINQKSTISQSYPVLPMALPAQGVYPPNMRATITPIPITTTHSETKQLAPLPPAQPPIKLTQVKSSSLNVSNSTISTPPQQKLSLPPQQTQTQQAPILPSLTDDMFVVEAPSFIVPYVYEKPPVKDLKEYVDNYANEIRRQIAAEEKELREREEKELKEKEEKELNVKEEKESEENEESGNDKDEGDKIKMDIDVEEKIQAQEIKVKDKKDISLLDSLNESIPTTSKSNKPYNYFDSPLGKFFIDIGHNLVQEYVQTDLLKQQKRKREREGGKNIETNKTISSLIKNLEYTKENNEPFHMPIKKCEFCSFKTESALAMSFHLETPHMKNFIYRCNFCPYEIRSPHDILFHMEAEHMIRGRLERAPAFHQCPNCPFEDNQKGKLSRHLVACTKKFKPERNLEPPLEWEPPAKIPRVPKMKQSNLTSTAAMYQAMAKSTQYQLMQKMQNAQSALNRGRGRPTLTQIKQPPIMRTPTNMIYKSSMSGGSVLLPTNYQLSGNQLYQQQTSQNKSKPMHQPSISITPLPRTTTSSAPQPSMPATTSKPGDSNSKNSFVICEICDGYIKDLEQLRNHMQWIHKVKIHPKMIYNRPPLNCQKCQFRFFTDQGLERHLLGSHGLVTSSMQEAANKSKDSGRCPVCGRVYQWKLLNHVARDHNMTLKPAHLSYKCTVCTATFGMYKQFENHVYSAHSVVAKRVMDKKGPTSSPQIPANNTNAAAKSNDSLLKPLKINDEITIIPQLPKSSNSNSGTPSTSKEDISLGKNSISVTTTPSTSKSELTRAERLARRKTTAGID